MFYVIEVTKYNNGSSDAYAIYPKETMDAAEEMWHLKLYGAIHNETYADELCMVVDSNGAVMRHEHWVRPVVSE